MIFSPVNEWRAIAFARPHYGTYPLFIDNVYFAISSDKCTNVVNLVWRPQDEKDCIFFDKSGPGKSWQRVDFMFTFEDFWFLDGLSIKRTSSKSGHKRVCVCMRGRAGAGGGGGLLENKQGQTRGEVGGGSKFRNLERTYFLNAPKLIILFFCTKFAKPKIEKLKWTSPLNSAYSN